MKKILLFASALAGLFLAGSCQKETLEPAAQGGVTYEITLPDGPQTKGEAGYELYDLHYEVYRINGTAIDKLYHNRVDMPKEGLNLPLDLLNDQTYTVIFWAQEKGSPWIDASDLQNIKLEESLSNNDHRDAFCAVDANFLHDGAQSRKVTLTRPFAQVNIATTVNNVGYDITPNKSLVTFRNIPTGYNLLKGETNATTEVTFGLNGIPGNAITVNGTSYTTVAMNYVLVADSNIDEVYYEIQTNNGTVKNTIPSVPVKKNYRTNIIGNLLTSNATYTIELKPGFATPDEVVSVWDGSSVTEPTHEIDATTGETVYVVDEASDLAWFAQIVNDPLTRAAEVAEYDFKLTADIDLGNHPWTPIGINDKQCYTGTFDGGNHTIKNLNIVETEAKEGKAYIGLFGYAKDATIKNLNFENVNLNIACLDIDHSQGHIGAVAGSLEGTSTIENVTVKGDIKVYATQDANGASRVAVVAGGNSYGDVTMKNVHVIANEGSYLIANNNTGALAGQLQGKSVFENCSSNIDVTGTKFFAGGIIGLAAGDQTFTNCHTTGDITITAGRLGKAHDHYRVGGIAGGWADGKTKVCTLTNCSYEGQISGTNADGSVAETFDYAGYVGRGYTLNGCQGSKVVIDGVEYVQAFNTAAEAGIYTVNGYYEIATVADLKRLATMVNAGEPFEGMSVKLVADIDLNNEEWTPIGSAYTDHGFMGNFDGNGYAIKNLKMTKLVPDSDNYVYAGLFGVTEGTETQENYIKNLIIENVTIETTGDIAAAAIAYPYYTTVENVTVKGNIIIKGGNYTSGVLAYTRRCVNAKNLAIVASANSVIEGNMTVGGVISDIQMNGGLTANYSNFSASGLTIKAVQNVGGISGIIAYQALDGATVENVNLVCNDVRTGIVSGSRAGNVTLTKVSYENVTGATHVIGASYDGTMISVATADELVAALEEGKGVYFENDIKIEPASMSNAYGTTGINIKNGQTIDGNGYTLNIKGAGGTWDSGINTTGGVIKNLTVTGSFRGIFINHTSEHSQKVVLENVTIGGNGTVYTISCDQGLYQGIEATNCTFNGWTSFAKTAGEAKFVNCTFGEGSGYKYCRPYSKTEFVECTFCPGYTVDTTQAEVTFTNCINL